jgi:trans-2,3-dihydro-3-hydroxyanthranilate isomerase
VFVLQPDNGDKREFQKTAAEEIGSKPSVLRRLRIFTPTREIPFAGHPVVGTWNGLAREGRRPVTSGRYWLAALSIMRLGIGVLPVDIEFKDEQPVQVVMTQGEFRIIDEIDDSHEQAELARALGLSREDLDEELPIQTITTGLSCLAVPVRSLADLARLQGKWIVAGGDLYWSWGDGLPHLHT